MVKAILELEMPESCAECPCKGTDVWGVARCRLIHMKSDKYSGIAEGYAYKRRPDCPLKPVEFCAKEGDLMIREEVFKFAEAMEEKLKANEHKGHWRDCETEYLVDKLLEELSEFHKAILRYDQKAMRLEGADLANIIMMLIDNYNAL